MYPNLEKLLKYCSTLGWYSKTLPIITIVLEGGFEAFSGRASETWEYRYKVSCIDIPEIGIKALEIRNKDLDLACEYLLNLMKEGKK